MEEIDNIAEDSEAEVPSSKGESDLGGPLSEVETEEHVEVEKASKRNTNKIYDWNMELKEAQVRYQMERTTGVEIESNIRHNCVFHVL